MVARGRMRTVPWVAMDIALSDLLTCPRCGPLFGLILLPEEVRDRRVSSGVLGCANCRERYRVDEGVADLRPVAGRAGNGAAAGGEGEDGSAERVGGEGAGEEAGVRLAALLGLTEAGGIVVLAGPAAATADALVELVPEVSVVTVGGGASEGGGSRGVSRLLAGGALPLRGRSMRGVALSGPWSERVEEGARLVQSGGRLVVDAAPEGARARVEEAGLRVLLEEGGVVVAGRER